MLQIEHNIRISQLKPNKSTSRSANKAKPTPTRNTRTAVSFVGPDGSFLFFPLTDRYLSLVSERGSCTGRAWRHWSLSLALSRKLSTTRSEWVCAPLLARKMKATYRNCQVLRTWNGTHGPGGEECSPHRKRSSWTGHKPRAGPSSATA
jgi:hypothetical protein